MHPALPLVSALETRRGKGTEIRGTRRTRVLAREKEALKMVVVSRVARN